MIRAAPRSQCWIPIAFRRAAHARAVAALFVILLGSACGRDVTSLGALRPKPPHAHDAATGRDASLDASSPAVVDAAADAASDAASDAAADAATNAAQPSSVYFEAEDGVLSSGFTIEANAAASNGQAIVPPADLSSEADPGHARASYGFQLERAGEYVIWGRINFPGANNNRFWFQLDGGPWYKWRISVGDIWYWDDFHDDADYDHPLRFQLGPGPHQLVIANCVPEVRLDRLYITADGDHPPGNDTKCRPPHSIEIGGECSPSCGALTGTACGETECAGREQLPAYDCDVCCHVAP